MINKKSEDFKSEQDIIENNLSKNSRKYWKVKKLYKTYFSGLKWKKRLKNSVLNFAVLCEEIYLVCNWKGIIKNERAL